MPRFSREAFRKIEQWMYRNARPLEMALWRYHFEGANRSEVLSVLSRYQNEDGGFGNGLDPDNWNPCSSPAVTGYACCVMEQIKCVREDAIVKKTIHYLTNTQRVEGGLWATYLPSNNAYPHASWWDWHGDYVDGWAYNPTIELCAFVFQYADQASSIYKDAVELADWAIQCFLSHRNCGSFIYYMALTKLLRTIKEAYVSPELFSSPISAFQNKLIDRVMACLCDCEEQWGENFVAMPIYFVKSPEDFLCSCLLEPLEKNLSWLKDSTNADGIWNVTWCWSRYMKDFYISENWWKSIVALDRACILKSFAQIEQ